MKLAADVVVVAGGEVRSSHGCEDVDDEAVSFSRMALAETEVDFGTIEVRMMDTATAPLVFLTDFLSDDEDGSGEEVAERLPFPDPPAAAAGDDDEDLAYSGSTRQAVGVSKSILCLLNR